ncbi:MAG TPA: 2-hydroxyacid dehydrogenase, partial [Rhodanobacteraceae bacterium]
ALGIRHYVLGSVLLTTRVPASVVTALQQHLTVDASTVEGGMPRAEMLARVADKDALIPVITDRVDDEVLDAAPNLKIIANIGVGYDNIDAAAARRRGVIVTNTPDVLTDDVADVAVALILMTARNFVQADRFVRTGEWTKASLPLATKLAGKTVGILGLGRIGKAIARRLEAMGMSVAYTGRRPQQVPYRFVPTLAALAADVEFLVVACPGGNATRHLVDASVLAALGRKGTLVNIARGSIVDEAALVQALADGTIKAAGLDVFENEPHVPEALLRMDNVVLLPHVGSATHETRKAMADLCKANLDTWFAEGKVLTLVPELA